MSLEPIRAALKSQYRAALRTLEQTITNCPNTLWTDDRFVNPYWQIAYHALFYTHLYLEPDEAAFVAWEKHRPEYYYLGRVPAGELEPYTREELLAYCRFCEQKADHNLDLLDLEHPESGFYWYPIPKLEHQIVNIRHLQHHAAQLTDRLRNEAGIGTQWMGKG